MSCVEASGLTSRLASVRNQHSFLLFDACTYIKLCTGMYQDISLLKELCAIFDNALLVLCDVNQGLLESADNFITAYTMSGEGHVQVSTPWLKVKLAIEKVDDLYRYHNQSTTKENQECLIRTSFRSSLMKGVHGLFPYTYERRRNIPPDDYVIDSGCSCTHTWTVAVSIPLRRPVPLGTLMRCLR